MFVPVIPGLRLTGKILDVASTKTNYIVKLQQVALGKGVINTFVVLFLYY